MDEAAAGDNGQELGSVALFSRPCAWRVRLARAGGAEDDFTALIALEGAKHLPGPGRRAALRRSFKGEAKTCQRHGADGLAHRHPPPVRQRGSLLGDACGLIGGAINPGYFICYNRFDHGSAIVPHMAHAVDDPIGWQGDAVNTITAAPRPPRPIAFYQAVIVR
jgi:hypothetical protein